MPEPPDTTPATRAAIAIGWLLLIPIALLCLSEYQGLTSGSYARSPGKAIFTGVPLAGLVLLSFALSRQVKRALPEQRGVTLFFWLALAPLLATALAGFLAETW